MIHAHTIGRRSNEFYVFLKGTITHGLHFRRGTFDVIVYSDVDWARDPDDQRSTSGYAIFIGPNLIS